MARSRRLRVLKSRIGEIEKHFMPPIRPNGDYTRRETDQMRAYRLLVHAEFESFIEDRAIDVANKACARYVASRIAGRSLIAAFTYSEMPGQGVPKQRADAHQNCITRVNKAVGDFRTRVQRNNHGIKEENVLAMLLPVGLEIADIDATLLITLDSYGGLRGGVAHTSGKAKVVIDPVTEKTTVSLILQGLEKLDQQLQELK